MTQLAMRILVVGTPNAGTMATLERLARHGWGSHFIGRASEAETLLETFQVDVVLAQENLPDGSGYQLTEPVRNQSGTLLVAVALSETSLWLSVVERGNQSLGTRAIGSELLGRELETLLYRPVLKYFPVTDRLRTVAPLEREGLRIVSKREIPPRRNGSASPRVA
ncbi:MAG: hypothetical protein WBP79_10115 [Candidatus Acidiferrales bacterium]